MYILYVISEQDIIRGVQIQTVLYIFCMDNVYHGHVGIRLSSLVGFNFCGFCDKFQGYQLHLCTEHIPPEDKWLLLSILKTRH